MVQMEDDKSEGYKDILKNNAGKFIKLLGMVRLLVDMNICWCKKHNWTISSNFRGQCCSVGFVSGLGELVGYDFRFASGYLSGKTHR